MKVITVSRFFPAYHPKAGQPTFFVEKICKSFYTEVYGIRFFEDVMSNITDLNKSKPYNLICDFFEQSVRQANDYLPKSHTIRAGYRFKTGEMASLRVWSGKPYRSPQIEFAQVKVECYDFEVEILGPDYAAILIDGEVFYEETTGMKTQVEAFETLAENDGLTVKDLKAWFKFPKEFQGQIICWNENITY